MPPAQFDPYQPPAHDEPPPSERRAWVSRKATPRQRLLAALVDTAISLAIVLPLVWKVPAYREFLVAGRTSLKLAALNVIAGVALWLPLHGYFLVRNAQTIGKRVMGIRIENLADKQRTEFWRILLWRQLPLSVIGQIPIYGGILLLIDALFIFRKDRRCLHDHLAGTIVVNVEAP
jgi:uncharacterized RDD family membrane protein YckC